MKMIEVMIMMITMVMVMYRMMKMTMTKKPQSIERGDPTIHNVAMVIHHWCINDDNDNVEDDDFGTQLMPPVYHLFDLQFGCWSSQYRGEATLSIRNQSLVFKRCLLCCNVDIVE